MLFMYGDVSVTFPLGSTKKSEGSNWNLRDVSSGIQLGFEPLSIVWPKTMGYRNGLTRSRTRPSEPGRQSFLESGTLSRGTTAASNLSFSELGMSSSDFQMRSAGPTWGYTGSAQWTRHRPPSRTSIPVSGSRRSAYPSSSLRTYLTLGHRNQDGRNDLEVGGETNTIPGVSFHVCSSSSPSAWPRASPLHLSTVSSSSIFSHQTGSSLIRLERAHISSSTT